MVCPGLKNRYGNSSPNDLVITGVFGKEEKVYKFLRTLRTVGCKARVVIITNSTIDSEIQKKIEKCGASIYKMKSTTKTHHMYPHSLRYVGYKEFLDKYKNNFNRILHADSFDVFYQSDPFTEEIKPQNLYFVMERPLIGNSSWNSGWLERAYNESVSKQLSDFQVSCSGTIIGGSEQFMIWLNTLVSHEPFWANGRHSLDQAYHNYLLHTGTFEKNGVHPEYLDCNSHILTMHYCSKGYGILVKNNLVYCPDNETIPSIVHQYNLFEEAHKSLRKVCSNKRKTLIKDLQND